MRAGSLDAFADYVAAWEASGAGTLPVIASEIGDSWLYGAAADPIKLAVFREARRYTRAALRSGRLSGSDAALRAYLRRLLKGPPEHNWGLSVGGLFAAVRGRDGNWSNAAFARARLLRSEYALFGIELLCPSPQPPKPLLLVS